MSIEVANESGIAVDEPALAALARYVLDAMRMHPLAELSVLLVDSGTMADLHQRWLGEPGPTDVLAFPMDELRPGLPVDAVLTVRKRTALQYLMEPLTGALWRAGHED